MYRSLSVTYTLGVSEWVCSIQHPTRHTTGHFRDESFQAIDCTGTDNQTKETKHYTSNTNTYPKHKKETEINALANKTIYILILHAFMTSSQEIK